MRTRDRVALEDMLRQDPELHLYELGDLDDFFFPSCVFFADDREVVLLYEGTDPPTLVALTRRTDATMPRLLGSVATELPARFYAHLTSGLAPALSPRYRSEGAERHVKMALRHPDRLASCGAADCEPLGPGDLAEVVELFDSAYPGNWFVPRMLETGAYLGVRTGGRLVAVAGVHVLSGTQRVAALGNVTTLPTHRGRGLARAVCGRLCSELLRTVDHVGLNVAADNRPALACYDKLGFEVVAPYEESVFVRS